MKRGLQDTRTPTFFSCLKKNEFKRSIPFGKILCLVPFGTFPLRRPCTCLYNFLNLSLPQSSGDRLDWPLFSLQSRIPRYQTRKHPLGECTPLLVKLREPSRTRCRQPTSSEARPCRPTVSEATSDHRSMRRVCPVLETRAFWESLEEGRACSRAHERGRSR